MTLPVPIEASQVTKRFGTFTAVDHIDFVVRLGECVGFLGPNGAGKTTTVRMITCMSPVTSGSVHVFGFDVTNQPRQVKSLMGVCPQEENLDPDFSVRKNLLVFSRYYDIPAVKAAERVDRLLDAVQLTEKANAKIAELSGGMKRRLVLARSLLNEPRLLVLDEPTTGLDPQARQLIWQRVRQLRNEGTTVLLTTHYMEEATQLCDRVVMMDQGKILLDGPPRALVREEIGEEVIELWNLEAEVRELVARSGCRVEETEDRLYVIDRSGSGLSEEIGRRFPHQERLIRHATLEDVFLHRAGRTLRDG
jgi:lipooligosaccharide transport system ATP-binding protein